MGGQAEFINNAYSPMLLKYEYHNNSNWTNNLVGHPNTDQ